MKKFSKDFIQESPGRIFLLMTRWGCGCEKMQVSEGWVVMGHYYEKCEPWCTLARQ